MLPLKGTWKIPKGIRRTSTTFENEVDKLVEKIATLKMQEKLLQNLNYNMPFKSEKQRRYLYKNEPAIAKKWTKKYGSKIKKTKKRKK